jgi:hypothetical protein
MGQFEVGTEICLRRRRKIKERGEKSQVLNICLVL